jgi:hypothetical protein
MAVDAYMQFQKAGDKSWLKAESQIKLKDSSPLASDSTGQSFANGVSGSNLFEIEDYSFDVEQTLNIGSQSSGTFAG